MNQFLRVGIDDEQIRRDIEYVTREAKLMHMRYGGPIKKSPNSVMAEIRKLAMRTRDKEKDESKVCGS